MKWVEKMNEKIKRGIRSWLQVQPSSPYNIQIQEMADFELNAIRNRIWYRGDGNELEQLYGQCQEYADRYKFWACRCTPGMEIRKIHTGLPGLIVKTLSGIVLSDMNDFDFENTEQENLWKEIDKENLFVKQLEESLKDILVAGDGAFKITIDTEESQYPILEWYPAERIELIRKHGRLKEIVFKTPYPEGYVLYEHYGKGYITNELYKGEQEADWKTYPPTQGLSDWSFSKNLMLAVPLQIYESNKYKGRGGSIFDGKLDSFDAFDEAWSQWMDALRAGRARTYIPESYIPRNPETGELLKPNPFDNRFIAGDDNMSEDGKNTISTEQPAIPHDSYQASYITALDLCLQGIISPSTLGIDVKKLDNAEAQREKEKATLYTRNAIIDALQTQLPELISAAVNAWRVLNKKEPEEVKVTVSFGEYANPSFESQVETLSKARPGSPIMSVESQVEELYGDSKEESWKAEEVRRLKEEMGIAMVEEPGVNQTAGSFQLSLQRGQEKDESKGNEPVVQDEPEGISGNAADSKGTGANGNLRSGKR